MWPLPSVALAAAASTERISTDPRACAPRTGLAEQRQARRPGQEGHDIVSAAQGGQGAEAARRGESGLDAGRGQAHGRDHRGECHLVRQKVAHVGQAGRGQSQIERQTAAFADEFALLGRGMLGTVDFVFIIFLDGKLVPAAPQPKRVGELPERADPGFAGGLFNKALARRSGLLGARQGGLGGCLGHA